MKKLMFALVSMAPTLAMAGDEYSFKSSAVLGASAVMIAAVLGGTYAQGKAAATTFEGIARNPAAQEKLFVPLIIGMALIESLVILGFVATLLIKG